MRPRIPVWITTDHDRNVALLKGAPSEVRFACDFADIKPLWSAIGRGFVIDAGRVPDFRAAADHLNISYRDRSDAP
jgi:hypothetical protein